MTELVRLRELAALFQPPKAPHQVQEAGRNLISDFDGLQRIVNECIADLEDKLGESGTLEMLLDKANLSDNDNIKDKDGATILERLHVRTQQYKKEVEKLMTEVEIMLASAHVNEGKAFKARDPGWYVVDKLDKPIEGPFQRKGADTALEDCDGKDKGYDVLYFDEDDLKALND
jgi:hypothetical protein